MTVFVAQWETVTVNVADLYFSTLLHCTVDSVARSFLVVDSSTQIFIESTTLYRFVDSKMYRVDDLSTRWLKSLLSRRLISLSILIFIESTTYRLVDSGFYRVDDLLYRLVDSNLYRDEDLSTCQQNSKNDGSKFFQRLNFSKSRSLNFCCRLVDSWRMQ